MPSEVLIPIILICISLLISLFGSVVGFGGSIFMVPILITFFHFELDVAVGTAMVSLVPSSLISTYLNRKEGNVDFRMGVLLELPTMGGVVLGSLLLSYIAARNLEVLFVLMVLILGLSFFIKSKKEKPKEAGVFYRLNKLKPRFVIRNKMNSVAYRASLYMVLIFGLLSGAIAGLFGVGGGFLKTPIMLKVFKIPAKIAAGTALFMIVVTSITGSVSHYIQDNIYFYKAWPVLVGFAFGALFGHKINNRIKSKNLEKLIGFALVTAAAVMMINFVVNS